jgi:hypothetical protein
MAGWAAIAKKRKANRVRPNMRAQKRFKDRPPEYGLQVSNRGWLQAVMTITSRRNALLRGRRGASVLRGRRGASVLRGRRGASRGVGLGLGWGGGRQFGRCACGCTPALPPVRAKNARSEPGSSAERSPSIAEDTARWMGHPVSYTAVERMGAGGITTSISPVETS